MVASAIEAKFDPEAKMLDLDRFAAEQPHLTELRTAGHRGLTMVDATIGPGDFIADDHDELILLQVIRPSDVAPLLEVEGAIRPDWKSLPGDLEVRAPHTPSRVSIRGRGSRTRFLRLPFKAAADVLVEDDPNFDGRFDPLQEHPFRRPTMRYVFDMLWREAEAKNPHGDLLADGAVLILLSELLTMTSGYRACATHRLSPRIMAKINMFIDEQVDSMLSMASLAEFCGMSQTTFNRSFKATTSLAPYQYVLDRRIAHAQEMLAESKGSIVSIAHDCGFASQSHMTDLFRNKLGITPGAYQRERNR